MSTHNLEKTLNTTDLIEDIYPLSPIQQGLLFHALLSPELDVYFQQIIFSIESAIDVDVLAGVWQRMAQRHSVFRTAFFWEGLDLPMQIVHSQSTLFLDVRDLRIPADEQQARIDQYLADDQKRGFNLSEPPLWRLVLLRISERQYKLILSFHHLLVDGWSIMLLLKEAKALYEASCLGVDLKLHSPRPYSDYIGWLEQQDLNKTKAWWRECLQGFSEVTALPFASAVRRPVQFPEHRFKDVRLSRAETIALENLVRRHQLTMNTVLLSAWGLLLGRHNGRADVVFGTTVSGRNPELAGVESMVGLFINTLPVRMRWYPEESVVDWLKRVQSEQAASYGLAHTPLVEIQDCSEIDGGVPLFETLLVFQNYSTEAFEERYAVGTNGNSKGVGRLKVVGIEVVDRVSYPLALVIAPDVELKLRLEYHASRFVEAAVERILQQLRQILQSMGKSGDAPELKVREVKWTTEEERADVVEKWNGTEKAIPQRCMHELFEEQAARTPEAVAVEHEEQELTYRELNQRANQLAGYLQKGGVGPEVRVGIYLDRTETLVVGFLAVLKAGGVYVPLDPNYPVDRLNFMIEETGLEVVLTSSELAHAWPDSQISTIKLDQDWEIIAQEGSSNLPVNITPGNLAYVIYTSGSTGKPKGAQIEHRGMLNHLAAKISDLQLTAQDVVAETAPSSFDISVWQMLAVLLTGGRVRMIDGDIARDAFQLLNEMQRTGVTVLETVPALLQMMVEGHDGIPVELPELRWMISNAEALPVSLCEIWKRKYPGIPLMNAYGPTECSDDISHYVVSGLEEGIPYAPLGRPLMNTKMYVVDEEMEPVPVGVAGELYIGGTGVGRGYVNQAGVTAECFVPNPFSAGSGERLYRTGDVVRQRPDGTLDFIGRRDHQVKIRGFRVELGEIETALLAHEGVKQAVVVAREDEPGLKQLVAYVVQNMSDGNPHLVADQDADKLSGWQAIWQEVYGNKAFAGIDPAMNIRAWVNSYTEQPFSPPEILDCVSDTVDRIVALKPRRVLEIGCGTGLILSRVAPHCDMYVGCDFSEEALDILRNQPHFEKVKDRVQLFQRQAHDLNGIPERHFDVIVLNEIIQYFPSVEYLVLAIEQALKFAGPGSCIFLGGVRNFDLHEAFRTSVKLHRASDSDRIFELRQRIQKEMANEKELLVAPRFFHVLKEHYSQIGDVEIELKGGRFANELTKFRYDVLLYIGQQREPENIKWINWRSHGFSLLSLEEMFQQGHQAFGITGIPNARTAADVASVDDVTRALSNSTIGEMREGLKSNTDPRVDSQQLRDFARQRSWIVNLSWPDPGETGSYQAIFRREATHRKSAKISSRELPAKPRPWSSYANRPQTSLHEDIVPSLREFLAGRLPEYMVPSAFVVLQELPLNANGKVDRKRLPQPQAVEAGTQDRRTRTVEEEILCGIWEQVLNVEQVGVEKNFFEIGGHSLLATQVVSRIRETFGVEIPLRIMFERPTVEKLAEAVKQARVQEGATTVTPLVRVEKRGELPLSYAQQRLWFLDQLHPGSAAYNLPFGLRLEGRLDREALSKSFNELVKRHEALRTNFAVRDGRAAQVIADEMEVKVEEIDLRGMAEEERASETGRHAQAEARQPFDLEQGALLRVKLLQVREEEHVLLVTMHHIVSDGWSMDIIVREIARLYEAEVKKEEAGLPELKVQYADYAVWQREWLKGEVLDRQIDYWRKQLEGMPVLEMPTDYARGAVESQAGAAIGWGLEEELGQKLKELARREGVTPFMVLLAGLQVLLSRYTSQDDIAVGTPIAGRTNAETDGLIGFFVNTLVMRSQLREGMSFHELLGQVRRTTLEAYEHQDVPFEKLVEELRPDRDLSRPPLFQVMFTFQNLPVSELQLPDLKLSGLNISSDLERFEMNLFAAEREGRIRGSLSYRTNLFAESSIRRLLGHFEKLLTELINAAQKPLAELTMMREEERRQVLVEWNQTALEYPQRCVHELFEEQASRNPKAIALEYQGQTLTYGELNRRANQLGHYLRKLGVGPEVRVGICVERSAEMVIGLLGILKAGAAYVPLDPDYPPERLQFMAEDAQVAVLLTEKKFRDLLWKSGVLEICLEGQWEEIGEESEAEVRVQLDPQHLAYVIYTSGSTGRPKGVGVEHRSIVRLVKRTNYVEVKEQDVFLQMAPVSFDAATFEIWGSLLNGCRLVLYPAGMPSLEELGVVVEKSGVTVLWLTAGLFHQMVDTQVKRLEGVRQLLAGGDALSTVHVGRALAELGETCLINGYGPTENTTFSCCHRMKGEAGSELWATVPIGRPITNSQAYVLDEKTRYEPTPVRIPGELYLGGEGLARGYMNRPELTAEKFVPNPFSERGGERLYRTGDRVRWRGDGTLEFVGRLDHQVKLRGYRIELGEIEAVLRGMTRVKDAAVVMREEAEGDKRLVAYVVMEGEEKQAAQKGEIEEKRRKEKGGLGKRGEQEVEWRGYIGTKLPEYMVPSHFVVLEKLPLTANGKLDRKALPAPVVDAAGTGPERESESPVEQIVATIYEEVLGVDKVGAEGDFFELGGHSLLATQVISRVRKVFEVEMGLRVLFENPTVRGMGKEIKKQLQAGGEASRTEVEEPTIEAVKRRRRAPLSYAQQRLWFIDQLEPGSSLYNVPFALRLRGNLDKEALGKSLREIVRRHEVLRTHFEEEKGEPVQVMVEDQGLELGWVDLGEEGEGGEGEGIEGRAKAREDRARRMAGEEARMPFDLSRGPLLRARLLRLGAEDHVLLVTMHHIVSDGWSIGILVREFMALYEGYVTGREPELEELAIQYGDYAAWQREWLGGGELQEQMKYWKEQLGGVEGMELGTDHVRPAVMSHGGATVEVEWGEELTRGVRGLCRREGVTLFMALLGGLQVLLGRYAGKEEVVVGTPIANRTREEIEPLIGFFVNTLVLRGEVRREWSIREMLKRVREVTLAAYGHQDVPFEQLVEELQPERDLSRNPLFDVMLIVQNAPQERISLAGLSVEGLGTEGEVAKFDLTFSAEESGGKIRVGINYARELYERGTIERMMGHFRAVMEEMSRNAEGRIGEVRMLSEEERAQLEGWNGTEREYGGGWVQELFEEQVKRRPEAIAVEYEEERLNYEELNRRCNQLGHYLRRLGVGPEVRVGLCMERSLEMVVAIMGVLKAGGAYVPLDPSYPAERLSYMLEDTQAAVLLTQAGLQEKLQSYRGQIIHVDGEWERISSYSAANPECEVSGENLAYVIYTSGSTGQPKGAMNTHGGLSNRVQWMQQAYGLTAADRVLQKTPYGFDVSVWEFMWPLMVGARLVMLRPGGHQDPGCIAEAIRDKQITTLHFVPAMLRAFLAYGGGRESGSLRRIICSGEALDRGLARECQEEIGAELHNLYGPTEASIDVTFWECRELSDVVMIGRPIANTQIHVLDSELQPVPVGVAGELYIGGAGLARGYVNQAGVTAERFVPNPFARRGGERLYQTGDRARWRSDGNLEYLGRLDQQVKVRGYRIELGEIEATLQKQEGVREAVVVAREDEPGEKRLVAYVVGEEKEGEGSGQMELDGSELRRQLRERLPEYMVPSAYVQMEEMPLNANGKVDRKRLPAPEGVATGGQEQKVRMVEEEILCGIWEQVLKVERVGVEENFFEIGGHSLLATQVVSRIRGAFGVELPLRILFERPTVAGLAEAVKQARGEEGGRKVAGLVRVEKGGELPLSYAQQRLWFLEQMEPGNAVYNVPLALRIRGELDREALVESMRGIVERHEVLRTVFVWNGEQELVQRVLSVEEAGVVVEVKELGEMGGEQGEAEARREAGVEAGKGFNLKTGPLLRVKLLGMGEQDHVLLVTMHHIVSDGWSIGILVREFMALYEGYVTGREPELEELAIQYGDYAAWQREWLGGGELQEQMKYWKEQLGGVEGMELGTDHVRPAVMSHGGATVEVEWGEELTRGVRGLCRREGVTLFMALLGGLQVLLGRYAGKEEVVVGTPIANRTREEIEPLIGFFVNTLVLRGEVRREWSIREMLKRVREVTLAAYGHQDVPFEQLVEELQPERDLSRNPLFDVMLIVQNAPQERISLAGLSVEGLGTEGEVAKFDLTFSAEESGGKIRVGINYARELYERGTIERMMGHFRAVMEEMSRNAEGRIGEVRMLSEEERAQLEGWNGTEREYGGGWVQELFEEQVKRRPEAIAVEYEEERLNYEELNRRCNQLGHYLRRLGVGPEVRVGLCMERSLEMVVAIMGVLKAGGAYVPLDPSYPAERLSYMLEDTQAAVLLTQAGLQEKLQSYRGQIIHVDGEWERISSYSAANPECEVSGENLAYVIYTSGSTGQPKGVGIRHASAMVLMQWGREVFSEEELSGVLAGTSVCFDLSVFEILVPLSWGGKVILAGNALELLRMGDRQQVKLVNTVPSVMRELVRRQGVPESVVTVNLAGEALQAELVRQVYGMEGVRRVLNLYGPSEDTTYSTYAWIGQEEAEAEGKAGVSIGRPVANRAVYVLDEEMELVPVGVAGELYIGGAGLARGYVNQAGVTAERFVPNPFARRGGERLYQTGDRARWRSDGNLEYLGRLDQQVKVRGYRIELGEIEATLQKQEGVREAVVVAREDEPGEKRLVAYVVGEEKEGEGSGQMELDGSELRRQLRERLPEYMVPSAYVQMEEMPLNANGKVDRKRLPAPEGNPAPRQFQEARDTLETSLQQIWAEVLDRRNISVSDNFFNIGGHSIKAVLLSARISRAFQKEIPVKLIFDRPTIEEQASFVRGDAELNSPGSLVPIQRAGSRQPIFCVHPFFGLAHCYQELSRLLGPDQPFYGLQCYGLETGQAPLSTIPAMAKFYLHNIRTVQPHGPYQLAGWSMGALIAYELAGQLAAEGETVSFLGLFEGHVPQHTGRASAPSCNEWDKLVNEREAENFRYMSKQAPTSEEDVSDPSLQMARYLAEFTDVPVEFSKEQLTRLSRIIAINQLAVESYRPGSYPGNVSLFRVPGSADAEKSYGWAEFVLGELKIFEIPGTHDGFMSAPSVNIIASHLKCLLHVDNFPSDKNV